MKKLRYILLVAAVAFAVVGCRKPVEVSFESATQEVSAQGGSYEIALKSNGEWTVATNAEWITVAPTSGNGDATLTLTVPANTSVEDRVAEITATTKDNTATLALTQLGVQYYLNVSPREFNCGSDGGEFVVEVMSNVDWTVSLPEWITSSVMEGSNNATVTLTVRPIEGDISDMREADVVFGNLLGLVGEGMASDKVHVVQSVDPILTIEIMPKNLDFVCGGETKNVTITTEDGWTASTEEDWVELSQNEGQGDAVVAVTLGENPVYTERVAMVTFTTNGGLVSILQIRQEASPDPHFLEVTPTSLQFGKDGGEQAFTIGCDTDWEIMVNFDWLSVEPQSGSGDATVMLTVAPNNLVEPRAARVLIRSGALIGELTVEQEAGDDPLVTMFESDTLYVEYIGGIEHANLISNTTWQLEAGDWITLLTTSGVGDATIDFVVDYNSSPEERIGYVNVKHNDVVLATLVVVQEGKPNILETDITELEARPEGGQYTVHVTANQSWQVNCGADWISVSPTSGSGNGEFVVSVRPLPNPSPRTGLIKLKGSTGVEISVLVTQHQ